MVSAISSSGVNASMLKQMQDEMFKKADVNGDGKITKDELNQVAQSKDTQKGPSSDEVLKSFDTNKDGVVTAMEELLYSLKNPVEEANDAATTSSSGATEATKSYTSGQNGVSTDTNTAQGQINISL